ncbi:hypothetical protein GQ600_13069 [Phytophthora cactorum]|nr:hypothetical protein GQ600_13069 [Phytophthora cactorum]
MNADHIGLKPTMEESETLSMILKATESVWEPGLKELREKHRKYRHELIKKHEDENAALSDTFWYFVYYNPQLPRINWKNTSASRRPTRCCKDSRHAQTGVGLAVSSSKVGLSEPKTTCWYVFWDDVYARNSGMKKYLKCEDFDPLSPTCICYMPRMERGDFEDWLAKRELLRRWRLFDPTLIKMLYDKMDAYERKVEEDREEKERNSMRKEDIRLRKQLLRNLFQSMRKLVG